MEILGDVTDTSAVVLLTAPPGKLSTAQFYGWILEENSEVKSGGANRFFRSTLLTLNNLEKDKEYVVTISRADTSLSYKGNKVEADSPIRSHSLSFVTRVPHRIAVVSCDYAEMDITESLWKTVTDVPLCLHIGDNIYGDRDFQRVLRETVPEAVKTTSSPEVSMTERLLRVPKAAIGFFNDILPKEGVLEDKTEHEAVLAISQDAAVPAPTEFSSVIDETHRSWITRLALERYWKRYYRTWSRWAGNTSSGLTDLSSSSHLFLPDDHDITDGYYLDKYPSGSVGREIAQVGEALHDEYSPFEKVEKWGRRCYAPNGQLQETMRGLRWKLLGETLLVLFPRWFAKNDPLPTGFLEELDEVIAKAGETPTALLLAFTTAPLPRPSGAAVDIYDVVFGLDGLWTNEQAESLYDWVSAWIEKDSAHRKALVVGGDLHIGADFKVTSGDTSFRVLVSSPISNQPTVAENAYAYALNSLKSIGKYTLQGEARAQRNYVYVDLNPFNAFHVWSRENLPANKLQALHNALGMKFGV